MPEHHEYNYPTSQDSLKRNKLENGTKRRSSTSHDYFLLLTAFALGLIGLWLSNQWFTSTTEGQNTSSDNTIQIEQELTQLKLQVAELTKSNEAMKLTLIDFSTHLNNIEQRSTNTAEPSTVYQSTQLAPTNIINVENDLARAEEVLRQHNQWSNESEKLLLSLEKDYAVNGLEKSLKNRLLDTMHNMYGQYIENIRKLGVTNPKAALEKIKWLQDKNNDAKVPSINFNLTAAQRTDVNNLSQLITYKPTK
jgi:hypothetical protein